MRDEAYVGHFRAQAAAHIVPKSKEPGAPVSGTRRRGYW